jgi:hypothetical protein
MEFTTKIELTNSDLYKANKYLLLDDDLDVILEGNAVIKWSVEIEAKEGGIKGITSTIRSIGIKGQYEYYDEFDELQFGDLDIRVNEFKLVDEMKMKGDTLHPTNVEVDFLNLKIIVS